MKLFSSFVKELKIASRGFYFYVEIIMAVILLFILLFVVPEEFKTNAEEYVYLDYPSQVFEDKVIENFEDIDGKPEEVEIKVGKERIKADLYISEDTDFYVFDTQEDMVKVIEAKDKVGGVMRMDEQGVMSYEYYLQGYETDRLRDLLKILHGQDDQEVIDLYENLKVQTLESFRVLTDRENLLPAFLTFNGSLMGLFIVAAYIFLDKKEGVIKAYAITPSPVWKYLLSKTMVLITTSIITSLVITIPVMGTSINYLLLIIFLIPTGFFASALGLLLASFYDDISKSFGIMFLAMLFLGLPTISYYIPTWSPVWMKFIPSYYIVDGFKQILVTGETFYVLLVSLGYLLVGLIVFAIANVRYKRTLSV